jgi:hypothetical protein
VVAGVHIVQTLPKNCVEMTHVSNAMITLLSVIRRQHVGRIKTVYLHDKFLNHPARNIGLIVIIVPIRLSVL